MCDRMAAGEVVVTCGVFGEMLGFVEVLPVYRRTCVSKRDI